MVSLGVLTKVASMGVLGLGSATTLWGGILARLGLGAVAGAAITGAASTVATGAAAGAATLGAWPLIAAIGAGAGLSYLASSGTDTKIDPQNTSNDKETIGTRISMDAMNYIAKQAMEAKNKKSNLNIKMVAPPGFSIGHVEKNNDSLFDNVSFQNSDRGLMYGGVQ